MKQLSYALTLLSLLGVANNGFAASFFVSDGEFLNVYFEIPVQPTNNPDTFVFVVGPPGTSELKNGQKSLGTVLAVTSEFGWQVWRSADSSAGVPTGGSATIIDFSSIANGSISGLIKFRPSPGQVAFVDTNAAPGQLGFLLLISGVACGIDCINSIPAEEAVITRVTKSRASAPSATTLSKAADLIFLIAEKAALLLPGAVAQAFFCAPTGPAIPACAALLAVVNVATFITGVELGIGIAAIVDEPPDPNFLEVFTPRIYTIEVQDPDGSIPSNLVALANNAFSKQADHYSLTEAWLVTLERFQGALDAGDNDAADMQLSILHDYIVLVSSTSLSVDAAYSELIGPLMDHIGPLEFMQSDVDAYQFDLMQNGFSPDLLQVLTSLNISATGADQLREYFLSANSADVPTSIDNVIVELRNTYLELADITECVANSCIVYRQDIEVPSSSFVLRFRATFTTEMGLLKVYLNSQLVGQIDIASITSSEEVAFSFVIDDPVIRGKEHATLSFILDEKVGSEILVTDVRVEAVEIDIKPFGRPNKANKIEVRSGGFIVVAILSTNIADGDSFNFDALQVDTTTVLLGPNDATTSSRRAKIKDVDKDGDKDLVLRFRIRATGISCGDTEVTLMGETFAGEPFTGTDSLIVDGCDS